MVVAAYLVGGFLVASVYAMGMLRGRRDRYHRLGFVIAFTVAAIATPVQMGVGDALARWVYNDQPGKFAAIELVPQTEHRRARDAARPPEPGRHQVAGGIPIPGLASWLSDPSDGHGHRRSRAWTRSRSTTGRPPARSTSAPGLGRHGRARHAAVPAVRSGTGRPGSSGDGCRRAGGSCGRRRGRRRCRWSPSRRAGSVTEVGRQPWIVYNQMKVEDAATANTGVWVTFVGVVAPLRSASASPRSWCCGG